MSEIGGHAGCAAKRKVNTAGPIGYPNAIAAGGRERHRGIRCDSGVADIMRHDSNGNGGAVRTARVGKRRAISRITHRIMIECWRRDGDVNGAGYRCAAVFVAILDVDLKTIAAR